MIRSPLIGAMMNFFLFGSVNIFTGQIAVGIVKLFVAMGYIISVGLVVDAIRPQWLSNFANVLFLLAYAFYTSYDGYTTVTNRK